MNLIAQHAQEVHFEKQLLFEPKIKILLKQKPGMVRTFLARCLGN